MSDTWEIPENWRWAAIERISRVVGGGTPDSRNPNFFGGEIAWITPADLSGFSGKRIAKGARNLSKLGYESSGAQLMPAGTVLFSSRAPIGYVAIASNTVCTNQGFKSFVPERQIHPDFLYYYLHRAKPFALKLASGTTFLEISGKNAALIPVPVAPVTEQARIADALDEILSDLDAGVAALKRVQTKLKHYRASVLKAAVKGALTADWRAQHPDMEPASALLQRILIERRRRWEEDQLKKFKAAGKELPKNWKAKYKEPIAPDTTDLPALPRGWCWATVEQSGEVRLGRQRAPQHHNGNHMRPYLRVANVYEARLDLADVKEMNFTPEEFEVYALRYGDVLLNEGQSPELVGRPAMYRDEIPGCCYQKTLLRFRGYVGVSQHWALMVFRSYLHSGRFRRSASITTSIGHLAAERFIPIEFPLPPEAEQEAIVEAVEDQLSVIDHLEADIEAKLKSAQALRQSILRHAFSGLLVPQDPNDEPASELLKRIAAEREERARLAAATEQANGKAKPATAARIKTPRERAATTTYAKDPS